MHSACGILQNVCLHTSKTNRAKTLLLTVWLEIDAYDPRQHGMPRTNITAPMLARVSGMMTDVTRSPLKAPPTTNLSCVVTVCLLLDLWFSGLAMHHRRGGAEAHLNFRWTGTLCPTAWMTFCCCRICTASNRT